MKNRKPPKPPTPYAAPGSYGTLAFGKKSIRFIMKEEGPFFAVSDIFAATGREEPEDPFRYFTNDEHVALDLFEVDGKLCPLATVSRVGAMTLGADCPHPTPRIFCNWMMTRCTQMLTPPGEAAPFIPISFLADGTLPPSPGGDHNRHVEWLQLRMVIEGRLSETDTGLVAPERLDPFDSQARRSMERVLSRLTAQAASMTEAEAR